MREVHRHVELILIQGRSPGWRKPNPQLEAALAQFAAQTDTTPDQQAQLRAALTADADRLAQFNQAAALGRVTGFALEARGNATQIGHYDKQAGIVWLPAASFLPGGTAAGDDLRSVVGLQAMSVDFAHQAYRDLANHSHVVSTDMLDNLQSTLNGSPVLAEQAKAAVMQGHLERFAILGPGMSAGATYDGRDTIKAMNLPAHVLQTGSTGNPQGRFDARDLTFVMGTKSGTASTIRPSSTPPGLSWRTSGSRPGPTVRCTTTRTN